MRKLLRKCINVYLRKKRISKDARILGSQELAEFLNGWFDDVSQFTGHADGSVTLHVNNLTIPPHIASWLLARGRWYAWFLALVKAGVTFTCTSELFAHYKGCIFTVDQSGLYILYELLVENTYQYVSDEKPTLLFDIGMNVGFASLIFALQYDQMQIVGFEPFSPIMERAKRNLSLNPTLAERITPVNVALSDRTGSENWFYAKSNIGCSGQFKAIAGESTSLPVQLVSASSVMNFYIEKFPNYRVIVKMDCEGGEYAIFADWSRSGFYKNISIIFMEYHELGGHKLSELEGWFVQHGFVAQVRPFFLEETKPGPTGMIIGMRETNRCAEIIDVSKVSEK